MLTLRLSNPYEGKKVKAFAKEKVWVLGSRVQSTLKGSLTLSLSSLLLSKSVSELSESGTLPSL